MLREREWKDGRFQFVLVPIKDVGYMIKVDDNIKQQPNIKQYFTKDEDAAMGTFDALIGCYNREGETALERFDITDRLSVVYYRQIDVGVQ